MTTGTDVEFNSAAKLNAREFAERLQAEREAEDRARYYAKCMMQAETLTVDPGMLAALNAIGTADEAARLHDLPIFRIVAHSERERAERLSAYAPSIRNKGGRIWDLLPPDTSPCAGDEIEDEGVWRPRPVIADCKTRYDRSLFRRREAEREYEANPCEDTQAKLEVALQEAREALLASDDETVREWDRIEQWRAGDGRETYNAGRRTVRVNPNADLSGMTDEQKAAHKKEQARLRKQLSRERAKASASM